jgi:monovalent cation:H+ antiporter-2, CPA2 family
MAETELLALAVLGLGLALAGWVAHRLGLPPALAYLAIGLFTKPEALGLDRVPAWTGTATHVAILFLLFFIGLELDLKRLREILGKTAPTTFFNIAVPALGVAALARLMGWSYPHAIVLGIAVSISSTIFGERISSLPAFRAARPRILGVLLGEDVGAAGLLAIIVVMGGSAEGGWFAPLLATGKLLFLLLLLTAAAVLAVPRALDAVARTHVHELVVIAACGLVLLFGAAGGFAGSAELGAFVAGVATAEAGSRFVVRNALASIREVALAVFLFVSGLLVDTTTIGSALLPAAAVAAVFLVTKMLVNVPASLAAGLDAAGAIRTALGLGMLGEFSLILVAAAEVQGVAHPLLRTTVVGAMVLLLLTTPLLVRGIPAMVRVAWRLPPRVRKPMAWLVHGLRRGSPRPANPQQRRLALGTLAVNLILLSTWLVVAVYAGPWLSAELPPTLHPFLGGTLLVGLAVAVAVPLLVATFRAYRSLVWMLVAGPEGERTARLRVRLVDATVALAMALLLFPLALLVPRFLPVILGGLFLAIIIVTLAWRRLADFHRTLEATLGKVIGQDPGAEAILDRVLEQYPWGVRFAAVAVPEDSPVARHTIRQSRLSELTGATVAVLQRNRRETVNPRSDEAILAGDTLVLMGDPHQLARAEALVVAGGEALRLTAQSRLAQVAEVTVRAGSPIVGQTLAEADLRGRTGTLVIGRWAAGQSHPVPYTDDARIAPGDRLILLGAPLQVDRARLLAEGQEIETTVETEPGPAQA